MTIFSLPRTLVAGTPENINHVQENFVGVRDHINGNLDATNFAISAKPATLLGAWNHVLCEAQAIVSSGNTSGLYVMPSGNVSMFADNSNTLGKGTSAVALDPAGVAVSGLTPKLRIEAIAMSNSASIVNSVNISLHNLAALSGGAGTLNVNVTDTAVGGVSVNLAPGINAGVIGTSGTFAYPSAGIYMLCVFLTGIIGADNVTELRARLVMRYE